MLSLHYYEKILKNNPAKLAEMKQLILNDFQLMEVAFFEADAKKDLIKMRKELHKMTPIVSNLKYINLSILFEKYRTLSDYDENIQFLHAELKSHLSVIYSFLTAE